MVATDRFLCAKEHIANDIKIYVRQREKERERERQTDRQTDRRPYGMVRWTGEQTD